MLHCNSPREGYDLHASHDYLSIEPLKIKHPLELSTQLFISQTLLSSDHMAGTFPALGKHR